MTAAIDAARLDPTSGHPFGETCSGVPMIPGDEGLAVASGRPRGPAAARSLGEHQRQLIRVALIGLTAAILVLAAIELVYGVYGPFHWNLAIGDDLAYYANLAHRLFTGGGWYPDRQLHGPWQIILWTDEVLYPPAAAWLFAPFIFLPVAVLLVLAVCAMVWLLREWRPALWTWPLVALCLLYPLTLLKGISGSSSVFVMMGVGLGLRYRWPSVFILLKPSFLPFALIGIRSRGWWIGLGVLVLLSLPFLGDTLIYPKVMLDSRNPEGLLYSLVDLPMIMIPVIAWLGRRRRSPNGDLGI